jgi:hypothetical protein
MILGRTILRRVSSAAFASLQSTAADRHVQERGQVLPIAAMFTSIFILLGVFLIDIAGVQNVADRAITGSLRLADLTALQERGSVDDYGRWYVCPPVAARSITIGASCNGYDGEAVARTFVEDNLLGDPAYGNGGYTDIFVSRSFGHNLLTDENGTNNGAQDGLDVEIIDPAAQFGQNSEAFINGTAETALPKNPGSYPECVYSTLLPGQCFSTATVILHIRLPDRHILSSFGTHEMTVLVKVGTDAN